MNAKTTDTAALIVTRFDVRDTEDGNVLRLFSKRVKVAEVDEGDAREDYADALPEFIAKKPRTGAEVLDFLGEELASEDDDGEEQDGRGSIVPEEYRIKYGVTQRCGDDVAETLSAYVTIPRKGCKDIDGGLDRPKLREVADANGIADKLAEYEARELNGGLLRMNISNILRGMVRRGEAVVIGSQKWDANPELLAERKAARTAARKGKKSAKKARAAKK